MADIELDVGVNDGDLDKLGLDLEKVKADTKALMEQLQASGKALKSATTDYQAFNKTARDGAVPLSSYKKALADLSAAVREGELRTKAYAGVAKSLADQLEKVKGAVRAAKKENQELDDQVGRLAKRLGQAVQQLDRYKAALDKARTKADKPKSLWTDEEIADNTRWSKRQEKLEKGVKAEEDGAKKASMSWLRAFAVFQSAKYTVQEVFDQIKEGAQQLDLERILSQQFAAFPRELKKAQDLTQGVVAKSDLTKSYALMSSFGIPMDSFAENMELVQKMAIRTGQSADFLTESFARGISRLSPLILDNLGIQVSLKDANSEYAAATGKLVTELTKEDQTAALLNITLKKLRDNTQGVSLSADSASASVARFETAVSDAWMKVKELGGLGIQAIDRAFQSQASDTLQLATAVEDGFRPIAALKQAGLLGYLPTELERTRDAIQLIAKYLPDAAEPWDQYWGSVDDVNTAIQQSIRIAGEKGKSLNDQTSFTARFFDGLPGLDKMKEYGQFGEAVSAIRGEQETILKIVDEVLARNKEGLTTSQKQELVEKAKARVQEASAARLKALEEGRTLNAEKTATWYNQVGLVLNIFADKWTEGNKRNAEALAQMDSQVAAMREQSALSEMLLGIREGTSVVEQKMNQSAKELSDIQQKIVEKEEAYQTARADGRGAEELASLRELRTQESRIQAEQQFWQARTKAESNWSKQYKDASDTVLKAEITRLRTLAAQLKVLEDQEALYQSMAGAGFTDDPSKGMSVDLTGSASALAQASELEGFLGGGGNGGGKGPGKKPNAIKEWFRKVVGPWIGEQFDSSDKSGLLPENGGWRGADGGLLGSLPGLLFGKDDAGSSREKMEEWQKQFAEIQSVYTKVYSSLDSTTKEYVQGMMNQLWKADGQIDDHIATLDRWKKGLDGVSEGLSFMRAGMDATEQGKGWSQNLFGQDIINMVDGLSTSLTNMNEALGKQDEGYKLIVGAGPALRAFTKELGANLRQQAFMEMIMNAAAAWASWGNWPKMTAHIAAATLYGTIALTKVKLPSKSSDSASGAGASGGKGGNTEVHIHIVGDVVQTEADRGVLVQRALNAARAEGSI